MPWLLASPKNQIDGPLGAGEIDLLRELLARGRAEALDSLRVFPLVELDDVVDRVEPCGPLVLALRVVDERRLADAIQKPEVRADEVRRQFPRRPRLFIRLVVAAIVGNRS